MTNFSVSLSKNLSHAVDGAIREACANIKQKGRNRISQMSEGGPKIAKTWNAEISKKEPGRAFAWSKLPYAGVFEPPEKSILPKSSKLMWLPVDEEAKRLLGKSYKDKSSKMVVTATQRIARKGGKLVFIPSENGMPPMLALKYFVNRKGNGFRQFRYKSRKRQAELEAQPLRVLFIGVPRVTIRVGWGMKELAEREWSKLGDYVHKRIS